jgi:hypothetical protein
MATIKRDYYEVLSVERTAPPFVMSTEVETSLTILLPLVRVIRG